MALHSIASCIDQQSPASPCSLLSAYFMLLVSSS